jgi:hypothetical protein
MRTHRSRKHNFSQMQEYGEELFLDLNAFTGMQQQMFVLKFQYVILLQYRNDKGKLSEP